MDTPSPGGARPEDSIFAPASESGPADGTHSPVVLDTDVATAAMDTGLKHVMNARNRAGAHFSTGWPHHRLGRGLHRLWRGLHRLWCGLHRLWCGLNGHLHGGADGLTERCALGGENRHRDGLVRSGGEFLVLNDMILVGVDGIEQFLLYRCG
jgi:hypothetical protein